MKILFSIDSMNKGGAERVISNLSNYLIEKYEVTIVATRNAEPQYELNKKIKYYKIDKQDSNKNKLLNNYFRIKRIRSVLKIEKPDIIISFFPNTTYRLMIAKSFLKYKTIISVRNDPNIEYNNIIKKIIVKLLYTKADGFVFQTLDAKEWFSNKIKQKATIIPNPINEEFIQAPYNKERKKEIVNVGRLYEQKNQELLIRAFSEVVKKHRDYKLIIIGEGALRKELENLIDKLGLVFIKLVCLCFRAIMKECQMH